MDNFEFRKFSDSLDRIATGIEHLTVLMKWCSDTLSKMGIDDQKTIDYIRHVIDDGIEQREKDHKSYYDLFIENEDLKKEIRSLNAQFNDDKED